jgi:hypothetical protein
MATRIDHQYIQLAELQHVDRESYVLSTSPRRIEVSQSAGDDLMWLLYKVFTARYLAYYRDSLATRFHREALVFGE